MAKLPKHLQFCEATAILPAKSSSVKSLAEFEMKLKESALFIRYPDGIVLTSIDGAPVWRVQVGYLAKGANTTDIKRLMSKYGEVTSVEDAITYHEHSGA